MSASSYIHGYDAREQARLIAQAEFWRELILDGMSLRPGERLLEIGCGAGAVLGVIGRAFPKATLLGVDIEPKQIERAKAHLSNLGAATELRVASGDELPFPEASIDQVFLMWVLEHLKRPESILSEARRVLRPGGKISITETDYNFVIHPEHADVDELLNAWRQLFRERGSLLIARKLGPALLAAGFKNVTNRVWGFHHFRQPGVDALDRTANYIADFIEPECEVMAREQRRDLAQLRNGIRALRLLSQHADAAMTASIYRATARA